MIRPGDDKVGMKHLVCRQCGDEAIIALDPRTNTASKRNSRTMRPADGSWEGRTIHVKNRW